MDTPPPTVSGSLHVGHVFSYTHTDLIARFMRMRGKSVFYPMGSDKEVKSEFSLVAGSNRDLERLAASGKFRADLLAGCIVGIVALPLSMALAIVPAGARAAEIAGVRIAERVRVGPFELILNGAGLGNSDRAPHAQLVIAKLLKPRASPARHDLLQPGWRKLGLGIRPDRLYEHILWYFRLRCA